MSARPDYNPRTGAEIHDRPRPLRGGTCYATRKVPRPLRAGDRVKDLHAAYGWHTQARNHNYPGAAAFGTVIRGPLGPQPDATVRVRFDDGWEGLVISNELERL